MQAINLALHRKKEGPRQRNALIGKPIREVFDALVSPSEELASLRLCLLVGSKAGQRRGPIPGVGGSQLRRVLNDLYQRGDGTLWHSDLRLRDLSELERRELIRALIARSCPEWRRAAA